MTLNGVMAIRPTLRYFTEFGKPVLQKTICGGIYARVYCIFSVCTMSSQIKFTFAISSPDEFLVSLWLRNLTNCGPGRDLVILISGGLAHRETGRFPGGPLLQEFFRAPGRTCEYISLIIS